MEELRSGDSGVEASERGLKELVRRWFADTQASHILHHGSFPDWFRGFAARKDAEDLLEDKPLGCFLIRLSDKTIGYILSYKGRDRCRHFVISQNPGGEFRMRGDCRTYASLAELIDFHKLSPVQPFREHLTSSCYQVSGGELYDVVNSGSSGVSVPALRSLWDQKDGRPVPPAEKAPPALPPKRDNRKLRGTVSVDTLTLTQVGPKRPSSPRRLCPEGTEPSDLRQVDRSRAPRRPKSPADEDESSRPPPSFSPAASRSLHHAERSSPAPNPPAEEEEEEEEESRANPLYHTSDGAEVGSMKQGAVTYSELLQRPSSTRSSQRSCEQIPEEPDHGNTYESVEEMKTKTKAAWGKNNMKWRHFLYDSKKK